MCWANAWWGWVVVMEYGERGVSGVEVVRGEGWWGAVRADNVDGQTTTSN